jgi:hypothetical protein
MEDFRQEAAPKRLVAFTVYGSDYYAGEARVRAASTASSPLAWRPLPLLLRCIAGAQQAGVAAQQVWANLRPVEPGVTWQYLVRLAWVLPVIPVLSLHGVCGRKPVGVTTCSLKGLLEAGWSYPSFNLLGLPRP